MYNFLVEITDKMWKIETEKKLLKKPLSEWTSSHRAEHYQAHYNIVG